MWAWGCWLLPVHMGSGLVEEYKKLLLLLLLLLE